MKAMVLKAPGDLALEEVSRPTINPGEVLVRVSHSGICRTDLKIFKGDIPVVYPRIMGHEMVGEVVETGSSTVPSGQRVMIDPELFCGVCFSCRVGQTHLCPNGGLLGRDVNGGFAEYVTAPASHVFPLPESIESRAAPLIQVLTTCLHAQRRTTLFSGESAVVLGLGVTGQLHLQLAKARGAHPVIGVTRSTEKRALAEKLGVDLTIPSGQGAIDKVREATRGLGADLVIDTTGALPSVADGIRMARLGGRLLMFGIITADEGTLPFYQLYYKELEVINARVARSEDYPAAIDLVQRSVVQLDPLISNVLPIVELKAAIQMLDSDSGRRMKIIMEHW
jgi:2-desacetyl-2-hydroxyethyl bacteriochlorophyllide A dehydrogenase